MARIRGIEHLPYDALKEIMIRVAGKPEGTGDIARAFAVCKSFCNFAKDEEFLRTVSFVDFFPYLARRHARFRTASSVVRISEFERHELIQEAGGLLIRCSRAGNLEAQLILSALAVHSASLVWHVIKEDSFINLAQDPFYNSSYLRALELLDHLSAQGTNFTELFNLVRIFLSRAKARVIADMHDSLKHFVFIHASGKDPQKQEFLAILDKLCDKKSFPLAFSSPSITSFMKEMYKLGKRGKSKLKEMGIDEKMLGPLLRCTVEMYGDIGNETVLEFLDALEPMLKKRGNIPWMIGISDSTAVEKLRGQLKQLMDHEAFFESSRGLLLARLLRVTE